MIYSLKNETIFPTLEQSVLSQSYIYIDGEKVPVSSYMLFGNFAFKELFKREGVLVPRESGVYGIANAKAYRQILLKNSQNSTLQKIVYVDSRYNFDVQTFKILTTKAISTPNVVCHITATYALDLYYNGEWHNSTEEERVLIEDGLGVYDYEITSIVEQVRLSNYPLVTLPIRRECCGNILEYTYKGACNSVIVNGIGEEDTADVTFYEKQNINVLAIEKTRHAEIKTPVKKLLIEYNGDVDFSDSSYFRLNGQEIILTSIKSKYYGGKIVSTNLEFLKYE